MKKLCSVIVFALVCLFLGEGLLFAQKYPERTVSIVVPYPPGGFSDIAARMVAAYASKRLGQEAIVVNKAGGAGSVGTRDVLVSSKPDGYTMLCDGPGPSAMLPIGLPDLSFDWTKRTWIGRILLDPMFFVVPADSKYKNLSDVVQSAKQDPKSFKWGTAGGAGIATFTVGQLFRIAGINVRETRMVGFQSSGKTVIAVAGGQVDFATGSLAEIQGVEGAGKLRPIAVILPKRSPAFPDVPTVAEAGFPGVEMSGWMGLSGPPNLPAPVVDRWVKILQEASKDPEFIKIAEQTGKTVSLLGPEAFKAQVMKDHETYKKLAEDIGLSK
jgi:tripartite-type tricarboxylate transporter receptor subunit TctC